MSFYFYSCHQIPASEAQPWSPGALAGTEVAGKEEGSLLRETGGWGAVGCEERELGQGLPGLLHSSQASEDVSLARLYPWGLVTDIWIMGTLSFL